MENLKDKKLDVNIMHGGTFAYYEYDVKKAVLEFGKYEPMYFGDEEESYHCHNCNGPFIILMFNEKTGQMKCDICLRKEIFGEFNK